MCLGKYPQGQQGGRRGPQGLTEGGAAGRFHFLGVCVVILVVGRVRNRGRDDRGGRHGRECARRQRRPGQGFAGVSRVAGVDQGFEVDWCFGRLCFWRKTEFQGRRAGRAVYPGPPSAGSSYRVSRSRDRKSGMGSLSGRGAVSKVGGESSSGREGSRDGMSSKPGTDSSGNASPGRAASAASLARPVGVEASSGVSASRADHSSPVSPMIVPTGSRRPSSSMAVLGWAVLQAWPRCRPGEGLPRQR